MCVGHVTTTEGNPREERKVKNNHNNKSVPQVSSGMPSTRLVASDSPYHSTFNAEMQCVTESLRAGRVFLSHIMHNNQLLYVGEPPRFSCPWHPRGTGGTTGKIILSRRVGALGKLAGKSGKASSRILVRVPDVEPPSLCVSMKTALNAILLVDSPDGSTRKWLKSKLTRVTPIKRARARPVNVSLVKRRVTSQSENNREVLLIDQTRDQLPSIRFLGH